MKKTKGLTFLEILIAIVITGIVLSSMLTGMNFASKYARHNANKTMALNFAQGLMEEIKDKDYEDKHAADANYHTAAYTNFLGPEFKVDETVEENSDPELRDDDLNEDAVVERIYVGNDPEFDDVDDYNGYGYNDKDKVYLYQKDGVNIEATRTVVVADQDGNITLDSAGYAAVTYKQITVTISWTWQDKDYTEVINTIVSEHN